MTYTINFTASALDDMAWFKKRARNIIFDGIEAQLGQEPNVETRNRKRLRPNQTSEWELRIDKYRVCYDVNAAEKSVAVKVVGLKQGNRVLVRGEEYKL